MNLKDILQATNVKTYQQFLKENDEYYEHRIEMLSQARSLFLSNTKLSEFSTSERSLFLGVNSQKANTYDYDVNLFGAPGGNGEVKSIIKSKYLFFNDFFASIPRSGVITSEQFFKLVDLFEKGVKESNCRKMPFVLFTRILTITRPDTFVTSADKALDKICSALGIKQVKNDFNVYWKVLLPAIHQLEVFKECVGRPDEFHVGLIDGAVWSESEELSSHAVKEDNPTYETDKKDREGSVMSSTLNQILYGPPGTGKTYHTIEAAVKAAEPEFYMALEIDEDKGTTDTQRRELADKYETLVKDQRVRFVTFHQSYGYEEFVEGLKARETDAGDVTYATEDGVFKTICRDASTFNAGVDSEINLDGRVWKLSIEGTKENPAKTYCLKNKLAAIGWGDTGDLSKGERNEYFQSQGKNNQNSLTYFSQEMVEGDIVLCIDSNTSIEAIGVITGEYQYREGGLPTRTDFCHQLPIHWLAKDFTVDFKVLNGGKQFNLPTCYPLSRLSVSEVLQHLSKYDVTISSDKPRSNIDNYVLIIDEINRGNISKIFGELITLIEPSKRAGNDEPLEVTLPHSSKPFSVPNNLHIIGTMNTADRSLAMMDTALRRRFDFKEMMPKPELFEDCLVNDINLTKLLEVMNKRIEVLYDREHTLGHAFLFPTCNAMNAGDEVEAFSLLQSAFQNKIIPLLEEYFYEDWSKISLVLGDNQKEKQPSLQFVREQEINYNDLFGSSYEADEYGQPHNRYELAAFNDEVWTKADAYQGIYAPQSITADVVVDKD